MLLCKSHLNKRYFLKKTVSLIKGTFHQKKLTLLDFLKEALWPFLSIIQNGLYINQISLVVKKLVEIFQETKIVQLVVEMLLYVEDLNVMDLVLIHNSNIILSQNIRNLNFYIQYTHSILGIINNFDYLKMVPM